MFFLLSDNGQTKPKPRENKKISKLAAVEHDKEGLCLFRATNGKKKLSTVVSGLLLLRKGI